MKGRINPYIIRRSKQIDDLVDEVYFEVEPCDYDADKFYIYFRDIFNWVSENFFINNIVDDENIAVDLYHFLKERYFDEFLDYFENAQLSCEEFISESENKTDDVSESTKKLSEIIADFIEDVSGSYLNKNNYRPCFVSVLPVPSQNRSFIVAIVSEQKYVMDGYSNFLTKKFVKAFRGISIMPLVIDNRDTEETKTCEERRERFESIKNNIIIDY